ncbi:MAG: carboxypeptidase regulatory-like domain-containing protein [Euryarchaeota archaeon]|nr:carboxypeptidase regulatory-like domain-containing protein [Euryarchaeota archaeon]
MGPVLRWLSVLLVLLLAGCAGRGAPSAATAAPTIAPAADAGTVDGIVVDEEQRPLGGADVWLAADESRRAITDGGGRFVLRDVPGGDQTLRAGAKGYDEAEQRVAVIAGESATVTFVLAIRPVAVARSSTYMAEAIIELGVNVLGIYHYSNQSGSDYRDIFYDVTPDARSAVVGLRWTAVSPLSAKWMFLGVYLSDRQCVRVCDLVNGTEGRSPLVGRADGLDARIADRGGALTVNPYLEIRPPCRPATVGSCPSNPDAVAQVAQDQRFQLYTSVFFVDPAPVGYSPFPA